ncbi:hypothetical protein CCHR01_11696 [Colletotrichum chrysophilum]|uniref:Uncharacterized protein n=1 Tax=Colletotrichum chrysophilum TaxID=1836956 RepID=A0AAD9EEH6_9PEZI|nr:hypothetical protein CCHR01_11696 [Colletotrichum chrysophilum]
MSWILILSVILGGGAAEMFRPNVHSTYLNTRISPLHNLFSDQTTGSYWTSSFLTTTGSQYLALSYVLGNVCKSSLLALDSFEYWNNLQYATPQNTSLAAAPEFTVSVSTCGVGSAASDFISSPSLDIYRSATVRDGE